MPDRTRITRVENTTIAGFHASYTNHVDMRTRLEYRYQRNQRSQIYSKPPHETNPCRKKLAFNLTRPKASSQEHTHTERRTTVAIQTTDVPKSKEQSADDSPELLTKHESDHRQLQSPSISTNTSENCSCTTNPPLHSTHTTLTQTDRSLLNSHHLLSQTHRTFTNQKLQLQLQRTLLNV